MYMQVFYVTICFQAFCTTLQGAQGNINILGMAATWVAVSRMANSSPALLPGGTRIVAGLIIVTAAYIVNKVTRYA